MNVNILNSHSQMSAIVEVRVVVKNLMKQPSVSQLFGAFFFSGSRKFCSKWFVYSSKCGCLFLPLFHCPVHVAIVCRFLSATASACLPHDARLKVSYWHLCEFSAQTFAGAVGSLVEKLLSMLVGAWFCASITLCSCRFLEANQV